MCGPKQAWAETNSAGKLMMQDTRIDTSKKKKHTIMFVLCSCAIEWRQLEGAPRAVVARLRN